MNGEVENSRSGAIALNTRRGAAVVTIAILIAAAAVASLLGAPIWILLVTVQVPWLMYASARLGVTLSVVLALFATLWTTLVLLMLLPLLGAPLLPAVVVVWLAIGGAGTALCWRNSAVVRGPSTQELVRWLPASLGGLIWLGVMGIAQVIPGSSRLAWVMQGDSANNILFAREIIYRGGIGIGPNENPVPLPSALMGVAMASGRDTVSPDQLLRHDLTAFSQVWALLIAFTCLVVGLCAASIVNRSKAQPVWVGATGALASCLPLSWLFTGYPLEFGFFNTHIAVPIVLAAFIAYLASERHPTVALSLLFFAATLLLAVWSPLVLMPAFLGLVIVVRSWREILRARGVTLVLFVVGLIQLLAYGVGIVLPSLLHLGGFLSATGGVFSIRRWLMGGLVVAVVLLAVIGFRKLHAVTLWGVIAMGAASAVGLAALLFTSRNLPDPWSYYPLKFAWFASAILIVLITGLVAAVIVQYLRISVLKVLGLVLATAITVGVLAWIPGSSLGSYWRDPIPRVLDGDFNGQGDEVVERTIALADPQRPQILWDSGDPYEGAINFWLLQMAADSTTENHDLRVFAYGNYDVGDVSDLCAIAEASPLGITAHTKDVSLAAEAAVECADADLEVVRVG